jgi:hypothetical protein
MRHVCATRWARRIGFATMAVVSAFAAPVWAQGTGLVVEPYSTFGPQVQARVGVSTSATAPDGHSTSWQQQAGVLLGDYYFSRARLGQGQVSSGFRATSGMLLGQRSLALSTPALSQGSSFGLTALRQPRVAMPGLEVAAEPWAAVPYVGIGWSGLSAKGGWGVSADFGFAGRSYGSGGLRVNGNQSLDDLLRELRITPMVQIGVSYAF